MVTATLRTGEEVQGEIGTTETAYDRGYLVPALAIRTRTSLRLVPIRDLASVRAS